jgi:hypothetical protein
VSAKAGPRFGVGGLGVNTSSKRKDDETDECYARQAHGERA